MTQEEKELLLKDLTARLPYGVKVQYNNEIYNIDYISALYEEVKLDIPNNYTIGISEIKPYLRPMSSMTEEEKEELLNRLPKYWGLEIDKLGDLYFDICDACYPDIELLTDIIDWLNAHHFDYRGLIEKGLALEAPKGMYTY